MKTPTRILVLGDPALAVCRSLARRGHGVDVLCPQRPPDLLDEAFKAAEALQMTGLMAMDFIRVSVANC